MVSSLRELYCHRELLLSWTVRQIKIRYKQTVIGAAWAILQPLALMLVFSIVFSLFIKVPSDGVPYPLFAYVAILPWTLTSNALSFAVASIVNVESLVRKIYFPREVIPLAEIMACGVDFLIASLVLVGMLVWYRMPLHWTLILFPLILTLQLLLTTALALFGAALNVSHRDVRFVVPVALQLWFYASPVIYPVSLVPDWLRPYYFMNPMSGILDGYRRIVLRGELPDSAALAPAIALTVALVIVSYLYFKKAESTFADVI